MGVSKSNLCSDRFIGTPTEYQRGVSRFPGTAFQKITFCVPNKTARLVRPCLDFYASPLSPTVNHCGQLRETTISVTRSKAPCAIQSQQAPQAVAQRRDSHLLEYGGASEKSCEMCGLTRFIRTSVRLMTETSRIPNHDRWERNFLALQQYAQRTGNARVPASHVELYEGRNTPIGAWVGYMRQRYRLGILNSNRVAKLESVQGWTWGPLRPGPASNTERDNQIALLRSEGKSLQTIADQVGVSRQRVHQIARRYDESK